jgi:predicted nucleic acid-binding protein
VDNVTVESKICVDASLALKLVLLESDSDLAQAQWQDWVGAAVEIIAPDLFIYETTSVLRTRVYRKEITQSEAGEALRILALLDITYHQPGAIRESSWELARRFNRPTAYDAFYLALAQDEGSSLWTGDKRFYNAVKDQIEWVHALGH